MFHKIKVKDYLYVPKLDRCTLSLHDVAQELKKEPRAIHATQCGSNCVLIMPGLKKTIHDDRKSNVPKIRSASGHNHYKVSSTLLETKWNYDDVAHICYRAVSSQEDRHWEPFLNEDNTEEAEIDKHHSTETN